MRSKRERRKPMSADCSDILARYHVSAVLNGVTGTEVTHILIQPV